MTLTPMEERRRTVSEQGELSPDDLRAIANGPIMDSNRIYLPAGKLTESEYRAREARIMRGEEI